MVTVSIYSNIKNDKYFMRSKGFVFVKVFIAKNAVCFTL